MIVLAKHMIRRLFPRLFLQLRVRKLLAQRVDPDMLLLNKLPMYLAESHETSHCVSYFAGGNTAIDVGACGGEYACIMARYFKDVLSVEPTPEMASVLRASLPTNCRVLECAMGKLPGPVILRVPKIGGSRMHALSTVANHDFAFSDISDLDTVTVQQITIDDLGRETNSRPAFIKIDVEGYEGEVLSGAVSTIESCRPMFLVEIEKRHNTNFKEIFASFDSYGYTAFHFDGAKLTRSSPDQVDASYEYLLETNISGMAGVIESRASGRYVNNFLFLPHK